MFRALKARFARPVLWLSLSLASTLCVDPVRAAESVLPADPPAVSAEGEKAKAALGELASADAIKTVAARAIERGKKALARAHGAKLAKDEDGARLLSRVALAWANAGAAAARAAEVLKSADVLSSSRANLVERLSRARALLAEHDARRLSLAAAVESAEKAAAERIAAGKGNSKAGEATSKPTTKPATIAGPKSKTPAPAVKK
jgi:hypothetical protein